MNKDSGLKLAVVSIIAIVILWFAHTLLVPNGFGVGINIRGNFRGNFGGEHMYSVSNYGVGSTFSFLLLFLIKVLFVLFIIGLVVGLVLFVKNNVFTKEDIAQIKGTFTSKKTEVIKEVCSICGKELNSDWKVCPHCGKEKEAPAAQ